ncbi:MAG: succinate dehydrogenase assembly factor 2 [Rhizobiaceae bacterium]|nr:succinate dehydrogenase assembly factor 2 [Rhizobiaceae bacterium]
MTELARQTNTDLETRRRRARFRAWHRGMREADLILGRFADEHIADMNEVRMDEFETLLEVPDGDLLKWMTGELPVPPTYDTPLFRQIRATASKL